MSEDAEGLRKRPARLRVGREAPVVDREACLVPLVEQVEVVTGERTALEHALVDDGAARERDDVRAVALIGCELDAFDRGHRAAQHVQLVFERVALERGVLRCEHELLHRRAHRGRERPEDLRVDRQNALAEHVHAAGLERDGDLVVRALGGCGIARQEELHDAAARARRRVVAERHVGLDEAPRDVGHHARAIAADVVAAARAAVLHAAERTESARNHRVRRTLGGRADDKADAARVALSHEPVWPLTHAVVSATVEVPRRRTCPAARCRDWRTRAACELRRRPS